MTQIYKIYENFETSYVLATTDGVINVANNISNNMGVFNQEKFTTFEKAKDFIENKALLNIILLDNNSIAEQLENITNIDDIGNGYIELS